MRKIIKWKMVVHYPNYAISEKGVVRNLNTGKSLRWQRNKRGGYYPFVNLYLHGNRKNHTVHSLVAYAFLGPRPEGHEIHHKDSDIENPSAGNLEYVTPQVNKSLRGKYKKRSKCPHDPKCHVWNQDNSEDCLFFKTCEYKKGKPHD